MPCSMPKGAASRMAAGRWPRHAFWVGEVVLPGVLHGIPQPRRREKRRGRRAVYVQARDFRDAKRAIVGDLAKELLRLPESPGVRPGLLLLPIGELLICTVNSWDKARHVDKRLCNGIPWRLVAYLLHDAEPDPEGGWDDVSLPPVVLRHPVESIVVARFSHKVVRHDQGRLVRFPKRN